MSREENPDSNKWFDYFDELRELLSDFGAFIIALVVIIAFIYFTYVILKQVQSFEQFKDIAAIWGVWVGSVIGYFFGSRPVDILSRRVSGLLNDLEISDEEREKDIKKSEETINKLKQSYDKAKMELQYIVKRYHSEINDTDLLNRLRTEHDIRI